MNCKNSLIAIAGVMIGMWIGNNIHREPPVKSDRMTTGWTNTHRANYIVWALGKSMVAILLDHQGRPMFTNSNTETFYAILRPDEGVSITGYGIMLTNVIF